MPTIKINALGAQPLFDIASYGRRGPQRRDRLSPAEIARISRTVHRAPEVMVKVLTKGATNTAAVVKHVDYIGRQGQLALETDEGERIQGEDIAEGLIDQWNLDLEEHRRRAALTASLSKKPPRLVHKLMLSMPAGTSTEGVRGAAGRFLREEFATKYRYAFVLHTDAPHPHVHAVVKAVSERGVRLRIDKRTLRRWREAFATHLRGQGIEANATDRAVRGQGRVRKTDAIFRAVRRGSSTHMNRRVQEVISELSRGAIAVEPGRQRVLRTRRDIEAGWCAIERMLIEAGKPMLAEEVRRFVQRLPPARTEKEALVHELLSRAQANRSKDRAVTR
jgi:hypothetical protein